MLCLVILMSSSPVFASDDKKAANNNSSGTNTELGLEFSFDDCVDGYMQEIGKSRDEASKICERLEAKSR